MFTSSNLTGERKYGTERTRELLDLCGSPDKKLKNVHIAGSNGKGSTAAFVSHVLKSAGKRVGAFLSPAVYSYEEQFLIDCTPATPAVLKEVIKKVEGFALGMPDKPTRFEIETAAAFLLFYESGCEYAVIECGLGGADDATNAMDKKVAAIITSVSLEHTAELGSTITEICQKKSGIVKNCPLIVNALQSEEGTAFFKNMGATFAGGVNIIETSPEGQSFEYGGKLYSTRMLGREQCYNAATAVECCRMLGIANGHISAGIAEACLKGRATIYKRGGKLVFADGGHTAEALNPVLEAYERAGGGGELIFGCLADKDAKKMADLLAPHFKRVTVVVPPCERAMDKKTLLSAFGGRAECAPDIKSALENTLYNTVVVCGSFTLLKETEEWIERGQ